MNEIITKLIRKRPVTESDLKDVLYDICDTEHSSCNSNCPVYEANGGEPLWNPKHTDCQCYRDGGKMLAFLTNNLKQSMYGPRATYLVTFRRAVEIDYDEIPLTDKQIIADAVEQANDVEFEDLLVTADDVLLIQKIL